ncbi:hypothetical protein EVAR_39382_1 [Eumeta japonica]|uniref:Uncharacterized protein n=1 Tax=Eumeta variegata TaxID=151549 RepID=A0A4C1ZCZ2_EUMVA|nr:hypothetical protein EVAR_39382_1 [Eumeta japonica]
MQFERWYILFDGINYAAGRREVAPSAPRALSDLRDGFQNSRFPAGPRALSPPEVAVALSSRFPLSPSSVRSSRRRLRSAGCGAGGSARARALAPPVTYNKCYSPAIDTFQ